MVVGRTTVVIALLGFSSCVTRSGGWHTAPGLGLEIESPPSAHVEETPGHAFVGDDSFALNLFAVDALSVVSADAQKSELERTEGFVRVTSEQHGAATWRFDYELAGGKTGTIARIHVGQRAFDCGVHAVAPDVTARVAQACSTVRPHSLPSP